MKQAATIELIAEGTRIAHYQIIEPLGAGGMGTVYKAHDEKLDRIVAVKVLPSDAVAHEDRRRRFLQEARAASALNHPHILTVYEIGEVDGKPFIVMEYIEGETLRQKIAMQTMALPEALDIALQITQGLGKAHEHGIVHRDLKPENLMITRDGFAKILDFGLAKLVERKRAAEAGSGENTRIQVNTNSGTILGTIKYMSPEQVLGRRIDLRSDIFSFGVVLYELFTGKSPFASGNDIDTMHAILHMEPKPPHAIKPDLPRTLHPLILRALSKEPKHRFQTIKEFATAIQAFKRDLETGNTTVPVKTKLVLKTVGASRRPPKIDYERELNEAQYEAVTTIDSALLIVAGAGTGKTRTLVYRVARLIETGARPESVLLLTFTRRAAQSMLSRAVALADERCQRVSGGTFHSIAHGTLRKYAEIAGVHRMFTVFDQSDTEDLIDLLRRQMKLTGKERAFPRKQTIGAIFSMAANKLLSIEEVVRLHYPQFIDATDDLEKLLKTFDQYKRQRHLLTYDDLLVRLCEALEASEELRLKLSNQYRYIMVDEYQDTNRLQAQIVRLMAATHDNVAVVGDECQAIYSFRGASFRNMLEFPDLFPDAKIIKLEENFRSTQPILDLANTIISEASEGYAKQLFSQITEGPPPLHINASDENEQSRFVVQRIQELQEEGIPYHEMAVLFRAGSHSFDLEIELGRHGIPFRKFGGIKFAESAHVKDVLAFLRVLVNPADTISWFRMLKLVDHIGDATVQQILDFLGIEKKSFRTPRAKEGLFKKLKQFPAKASYKDQLVRLAHLLQNALEAKTVRAQLTAVAHFYRPILPVRFDDHPRRQREIEHLLAIAKRYKSAEELLADVTLDPTEMVLAESQARGQGFVTLSTVHSAKGLEWHTLFLIWMVDGWFPSSRAYEAFADLEEERRLMYVAATRAKHHLYFISPMSPYETAGTSSYGSVSRFLEPIPETLLVRATLAGES